MIYVSSSCIKAKYIRESVLQLTDAGFKNIELSGGTQPYDNMLTDLLELKEKYSLNYLLHNYFPPPESPFVVNLAALDNETADSTREHLKRSLIVSRELKTDKFGFHAGFLINIPMNEMGKEVTKQQLFDSNKSMEAFCSRFSEIKFLAGNIDLYIENNVLSETNYKNFDSINPFHFTDLDSYHELAERIKFKPLIDVGHLKVSCYTLKLDFTKQLEVFLNMSDYIHISDNDSLRDANEPLVKNSELYDLISRNSLKNKTVTIEVYSGMKDIVSSYQAVEELQK
jgi:sugar phosphate isomerase/epimerase